MNSSQKEKKTIFLIINSTLYNCVCNKMVLFGTDFIKKKDNRETPGSHDLGVARPP